jgi:hypothetical protein
MEQARELSLHGDHPEERRHVIGLEFHKKIDIAVRAGRPLQL